MRILLLAVVLILGGVVAMPTQSATAHDPHEVVSGDTLWDITESHTGDPFNWVAICDRIVDDLDREAQRRDQPSSNYCSLIYPGTFINVSGSGGVVGDGANGQNIGGANGESTGGADGSGNGVATNPDPLVFVCDGRLIETEEGALGCTTASEPEDDELTLALIGLLEEGRDDDEFPLWAVILLSTLGALVLLMIIGMMVMGAAVLFGSQHHHHHGGPFVLRGVIEVTHLFPGVGEEPGGDEPGPDGGEPGSGDGGSTPSKPGTT